MKIVLFILMTLIFLGCEKRVESAYDSSVPPVTSGTWYKPDSNTSWQWQLSGDINTSYSVEVYDIDLFEAPQSVIDTLHAQGKKVVCYFSGGSYENWRSDKDTFSESILGNDLDGWPGERWLDIRSADLKSIMRARLDLAVSKGCDGVEPDNMDGYIKNSGFDLSSDDQLGYNKFIANEARKRGLAVGLKNDIYQVVELEPYFDFSVIEECHQYNECSYLTPFVSYNKPVFNAEYDSAYVNNTNGARDAMCSDSAALGFQTLVLPVALDDSFRIACP